MKLRIFTVFAMMLLTLNASAQPSPKNILRNAGAVFRSFGFHAEVSIQGKNVIIEKLPGEFSFFAVTGDQNAPTQSLVVNSAGSFYRDDSESIRFSQHIPVAWFTLLTAANEFSNNPRTEYQMTDSSYGSLPCVLITAQIPDDENTEKLLQKRFPDTKLSKAKAAYPFRGVFLIGKDVPFAFSYAVFDREGKRIAASDWGNVDFKDFSLQERLDQDTANVVENKNESDFFKRLHPFILPENQKSSAEKGVGQENYTVKNYASIKASEEYASVLVRSALEATRHANFTTDIVIDDNVVESKKIFQKCDPATGIVLCREETYFQNKPDTPEGVFLTTQDGSYLITDKIIVKSNGMKQYMATLLSRASRFLPPSAKYRVASGNYNGTECYKISVEIMPDSFYVKNLQEQSKAGRMDEIPSLQLFLIDKELGFLYSYEAYDKTKKMIFARKMGKIVFNSPEDSLFVLPEGEISQADNYYKLKAMVQQANGTSSGSSLVSQISSIPGDILKKYVNSRSILKWGSWIGIAIAIIAFCTILFIKIRAKSRYNQSKS